LHERGRSHDGPSLVVWHERVLERKAAVREGAVASLHPEPGRPLDPIRRWLLPYVSRPARPAGSFSSCPPPAEAEEGEPPEAIFSLVGAEDDDDVRKLKLKLCRPTCENGSRLLALALELTALLLFDPSACSPPPPREGGSTKLKFANMLGANTPAVLVASDLALV